jgi:hypothetical protein
MVVHAEIHGSAGDVPREPTARKVATRSA